MRSWNRMSKVFLTVIIAVTLFGAVVSQAFAFGRGAQGPDVYAVQAMLKSIGYYAGPITGNYGTQTEAGVKYFQQRYGLEQTGAVNDETLQSILWAYGNAKIPKKQPPQPTQPKVPAISDEEYQMLQLVNADRQSAGLKPFAMDEPLSNVARTKSKDMIDRDYFAHQSPTYGSPFEMMRTFGVEYRSAAENIACNNSVQAAHTALMNSPGHRANLLNKEYTFIGIGIVNGGKCGKMFTQMFISKP